MVNALGERRSKVLPIFTRTSKWTQSHLILLQPNCIYSFLQGKSKIEFWREDFLRLFKGPYHPDSLLIPQEGEGPTLCRKLLQPKSFQTIVSSGRRDTIFAIWQTKCQLQRFMLQRNQKLRRPWTSKTITKSKIGLLLRSFDFCELTLFLGERLTASVHKIELKKFYFENRVYSNDGRVAQRITRLPTDQKIAGSNPAVLEISFWTFCKMF